jgi:hypothetical protein
MPNKTGEIEQVGRFHQHYGAKQKCVRSHSTALEGTIQFHRQNMPNFTSMHG